MGKYLLVGGTKNGQYYEIPDHAIEYKFPVPEQFNAQWFEDMYFLSDLSEIEYESYERKQLGCKSNRKYVYILKGLEPFVAHEKLVDIVLCAFIKGEHLE